MWRRGVLKSIDCLSIGIIEYIFGMENQQLITEITKTLLLGDKLVPEFI